MELIVKSRERVKAFFKEGNLALVLKLSLPFAESENTDFCSRFNSFYDALYKCYREECERYSAKLERGVRPISFTVHFEEKRTPVGDILITRMHKLRLPGGEKREFESLDMFDASGLLQKPKRKSRKSKRKV